MLSAVLQLSDALSALKVTLDVSSKQQQQCQHHHQHHQLPLQQQQQQQPLSPSRRLPTLTASKLPQQVRALSGEGAVSRAVPGPAAATAPVANYSDGPDVTDVGDSSINRGRQQQVTVAAAASSADHNDDGYGDESDDVTDAGGRGDRGRQERVAAAATNADNYNDGDGASGDEDGDHGTDGTVVRSAILFEEVLQLMHGTIVQLLQECSALAQLVKVQVRDPKPEHKAALQDKVGRGREGEWCVGLAV